MKKHRKHTIVLSLSILLLALSVFGLQRGLRYLNETWDIEKNGTYTEEYWNKYVNRRYYMIESMEKTLQINSLSRDEIMQILGTNSVSFRDETENGVTYVASIGYHDIDIEIGVTFSYYIYFDTEGGVIDTFLWEGS